MNIEKSLDIPEEIESQEIIEPADPEPSQTSQTWLDRLLGALSAPAKREPVEGYRDHPLNFAGSQAIARILRGIEGLAGDLDYAVIDVILGVIEYLRGRSVDAEQSQGDFGSKRDG